MYLGWQWLMIFNGVIEQKKSQRLFDDWGAAAFKISIFIYISKSIIPVSKQQMSPEAIFLCFDRQF